MKIGIIIDHSTSLYSWQRMGKGDNEYIIYRDQLFQHSSHSSQAHHLSVMHRGIEYLVNQGVDQILCPPVIESYYHTSYHQIISVFQQFCHHALQYSLVGKIGFIGNLNQCEMINMMWGDLNRDHTLTHRQVSNRYFHNDLPIRSSHDSHLGHWLVDHKPDHWICNHLIKSLLRPLKDAAVDTIIGLDRSYWGCDTNITHHSRQLKRHRNDILQSIRNGLLRNPDQETKYSVQIHHTGTIRDLINNKKLRRILSRGKQVEIEQININ